MDTLLYLRDLGLHASPGSARGISWNLEKSTHLHFLLERKHLDESPLGWLIHSFSSFCPQHILNFLIRQIFWFIYLSDRSLWKCCSLASASSISSYCWGLLCWFHSPGVHGPHMGLQLSHYARLQAGRGLGGGARFIFVWSCLQFSQRRRHFFPLENTNFPPFSFWISWTGKNLGSWNLWFTRNVNLRNLCKSL